MLHFNLQWKLGSPKFYNVFHVGTRIPELGTYVWGLGYGIGYRKEKTEKHCFYLVSKTKKNYWFSDIMFFLFLCMKFLTL